MANYAIITGIDIEFQDQGRLVGCAYKNTLEIHKFLCSIGYDTIRMFGSRVTKREILDELKWVRGKLKRGDKFLFYYYGRAAYTHTAQYIVLDKRIDTGDKKNSYISINLIKQITDIRGVERIIMLDIYQVAGGSDGVNGLTDGINKTLIKTAMDSANSKSPKDTTSHFPVGYYFVYNNRLPPDGDSVFAKAVLANFTRYARYSLGISFPSICKSISESFKKRAVAILPEDCAIQPCFEGDKVVLLSQEDAVLRNSKHLSSEQKKVKREADQLLELAFSSHETWLKSTNRADVDNDRLSWGKLAPILEMYESAELDPPALTCRQIDEADFSSARILNGLDFSGSSFFHCSFHGAKLDRVNFSKCLMSRCDLTSLHAVQCDFSYLNLFPSHCDFSDFIGCCFQNASLGWSHFNHCILDVSSFLNADVSQSFFLRCLARRADFTNANLEFSVLSQTDFSGASLTGSRLYGTARAAWRLQDVKCRYVFWDQEGKERFPSDNDFEEGEFTTQYRDYKMFSYTFSEGITPLDLMLATHIVEEINKADMGFRIKIDNASLRGLNPTLNFIMESEDDEKRETAWKLFKAEYECRIALLEQELQGSKDLLEERGQRTDLAEQQLSKVIALVNSGTSGLTAFRQFSCLMEELFKKGGLISQYAKQLKTTADSGVEDIANFSSKDLGKYDYLVLVDIPDGKTDIDELNLMRSTLERFMKHKGMVVFSSELEQAPDNAFVRSIYGSVFGKKEGKAADIAVATVHKEVNERLYMKPLRHKLLPAGDSRFLFLDALNRSLENLRFSMEYTSIEDIPLPELHHTLQGLVVPNGRAVKKCRDRQRKNQTDFAADCCLDRKVISKIENGNPVKLETMKMIADKTDKTADELLYTRVVPLRKKLIQLREDSELTPDEAAQKTGLPSGSYIQQLENAAYVSARVMRVVHYLYEKYLLEESIPFSDLIDLDATERLST